LILLIKKDANRFAMKNFLKQNSVILALFIISLGSTIFFYSRSQIPTPPQTEVQTSKQEINILKETVSSTDNPAADGGVTPLENNVPTKINGVTSVSSSSTNVENTSTSSQQKTEQATISTTLRIPDIGYESTIAVTPGSSAYDLMNTLREDGLTFSAEDHGSLGVFINSIGGIENDYKKHMFWIYSINETKAQIGISNYILTQDDIITWRYEAEDI